jgi:hypothetical protein
MSSLSKIGDSFPPEMKKSVVRERLRRGLVIKAVIPDVSYAKYFIFMGYEPEYQEAYGFLINTPKKDPALARKNIAVRDFQVPIEQKTHTFLKYDSEINCFEYYTFEFSEMINALIDSPSKICGDLSPDTLAKVEEAAETNPSFPPYDRNVLTGQLILPAI